MKIFQKKQWKYISIVISFFLILLIGFQNCQNEGVEIMLSGRSSGQTTSSTTTSNPTTSQNSLSIIATSDETQTPYDHFPTQTTVVLQLTSSDESQLPDFNSFQWGITEILFQDTDEDEPNTESQITITPSLTYAFEEMGVYDVSVIPVRSGEDELESAKIHTTLVIERCEAVNSLEIQLEPNTQDQSSTFIVKDSSGTQREIQHILWDVRHNGQKIDTSFLEVNSDGELTVTWNNILGQVSIRAFIQFTGDNCITDKKMQINLGSS